MPLGTFASGFPDLTAVEEFLQRLEDLAEDAERLQRGEHVSGPAADIYRQRVTDARATFAGRVLRSSQQVRALTDNPALQIFPGQGMTCVFDARTAVLPDIENADVPGVHDADERSGESDLRLVVGR